MNILVLGATGYVGGQLVPRLIERGHSVRCLVRDQSKVADKPWSNHVEITQGDVLKPETLAESMNDIDVVYYLIHSMGADEKDFESLDRKAATNVSREAAEAGASRIIYLGGLGRKESETSPHLRSRHEVGEVLREGSVPLTEFRAAVIVGIGSISFEMIHYLVNRLPVMICPRWVYTRTQPIAITDVLKYLVESLDHPETADRVLDIGGPEIITYQDMMLTLAEVLGLKRLLIRVPVLTPRLSSYWVDLVTPIKASIARPLVEGLRSETVCENHDALDIFGFQPITFKDAVRQAMRGYGISDVDKETDDTGSSYERPNMSASQMLRDHRETYVEAPTECVYRIIASIGGDNGWYYVDWLWKLRGFIDRLLGGPGLRRGRKHPTRIAKGETLDFWRVIEAEEGKLLILKAEMKVWGQAWLKFRVREDGDNACRVQQTALYYPKGVVGWAHWYCVYPIHAIVFKGLVRAIARRAKEQHALEGQQ
jgi:uncharacterized protein YbjT (DUF2867 family)